MTPLEDSFMGTSLDKGQIDGDPGIDAGQYSFFGDLTAADGSLEGALEEGLEAPPEEELALDPDLQLDEDEDLSYASMFAIGLDHDREESQRQSAARADGPLAAHAGNMETSLQEEAPLSTPPAKLKLGSIALGGLLASTPSGMPTPPLGQGTPFGSLPGSSGGFMGGGGFPGPPMGMTQSLSDPAIAHIGAPPQHMPSMHGLPPPGRPLSAQELEAQLLSGGAPPQLALSRPPPPPYPPMQLPMAMGPPGGHYPQLHMQPPMHGHPPPPPPPHLMQQQHHHHHQQQQPFDANSLHPYPRSPPMHGGPPGPPGPPRPMMPGGGFGPEGMMQQHHRPYPPPPAVQYMGGPPGGHYPPPPMPPPPLGGGMPRGPMRPGMAPSGMRPGPPGPFRPHMPGGMPMGPPMHPGPWARPPFPPVFHQQQPPTLAQRLRALNLADRHEEHRAPMLRRRYQSKYMTHDDIESILYMQWKPLHMGSPYVEDYYYQAFVYKHYNRRNRHFFAPESVRELAPTERMAPDQVAFVKLEGLGKVPFSNIRRPRPLMDLTTAEAPKEPQGADGTPAGAEAGGTDVAAPSKPLEQEPLLAARIMIEDCMALLLDVEDIDRIFVASAGGPVENEQALCTRRVLLVEGFAVSLRLPESPVAGEGAKAEMSDGVFVRLMSLPKGKTLTARALRLVYPPLEKSRVGSSQGPLNAEPAQQAAEAPAAHQPPNLRVAWAVMRNLRVLFSGKTAAGRGGKDAFALKDDMAASAKLAASAADLVKQLPHAQAVCDCMAAILAGDLDGSSLAPPEGLLLPLFAQGHKAADTQVPWLASVLLALLERAGELDLAPDTSASAPSDEPPAELAHLWRRQFGQMYTLVHRHVSALHEAFKAGREMGDAEGCGEVHALVPISLIRTMLLHCSQEQQEEMRGMLVDFGA